MNTGAVMGKKAVPNAFVGFRQGNVRQVEPDDEVAAQGGGPLKRRTCISSFFQETPELRREVFADLDLRRHPGPPDLKQMPEEPDRKSSAIPTRSRARPGSARAVAFMPHETAHEADVECVEAQTVGCQPDRNMPGCTGHFANLPSRKSKAFQMLSATPDHTGIPFLNHIGQWRTKSFRRHDLSPFSVKTDRSRADFYGNRIGGKGVS